MDREDLIYVAGFFDGDGSIYISRNKRGNSHTYRLEVSITQKMSLPLFNALQKEFGGVVRLDNYERAFRYHLCARQAGNFLATIAPFLRIKHEQARLALKFRDHKAQNDNPRTEEQIQYEDAIRERLRTLNRRKRIV